MLPKKFQAVPDLIPRSMWGKNVRSEFAEDWPSISAQVREKNGFRCESCGHRGVDTSEMHCHEEWRWGIDKDTGITGVQQLVALRCICQKCHDFIHIGRSMKALPKDYVVEVIQHAGNSLRASEQEIIRLCEKAFKQWEKKNEIEWRLDMSALKDLRLRNVSPEIRSIKPEVREKRTESRIKKRRGISLD